jgi:hypothetical protein
MLLLRGEKAYEKLAKLYKDNEIEDVYYSPDPFLALRDRYVFFPPPPQLERTLALVKPGWADQDINTIRTTIEQNHFVIIGETSRLIDPKVAAALTRSAYLSSLCLSACLHCVVLRVCSSFSVGLFSLTSLSSSFSFSFSLAPPPPPSAAIPTRSSSCPTRCVGA